MKHLEDDLQAQCVKWFELQHPKKLIFSIPNAVKFGGGSNRGAFIGMMMKAKRLGLRSGVPDLMVAHSCNGFHGLFIELKCGKNKPSEEQKLIIEQLRKEGYLAEVIYTFEDFVETVNDYMRWKT